MASIKISGLTEQTTANDTDLLPVASSAGMAKRMTLANFATWLASKLNSKFAPAGYGLGATAKILTNIDLNTVVENGWYCWNKDSGVTNSPYNLTSIMFVENFYNTKWCKQTVTLITGDQRTTISRVRLDGAWYPWEYLNPPMELGVEYRTTERWNGKPVYFKLIDLGEIPNISGNQTSVEKRVATGIFWENIISVDVVWTETGFKRFGNVYCSSGNVLASVNTEYSNIFIYSRISGKSISAYALLRYV